VVVRDPDQREAEVGRCRGHAGGREASGGRPESRALRFDSRRNGPRRARGDQGRAPGTPGDLGEVAVLTRVLVVVGLDRENDGFGEPARLSSR